jgi:hypothetical protein
LVVVATVVGAGAAGLGTTTGCGTGGGVVGGGTGWSEATGGDGVGAGAGGGGTSGVSRSVRGRHSTAMASSCSRTSGKESPGEARHAVRVAATARRRQVAGLVLALQRPLLAHPLVVGESLGAVAAAASIFWYAAPAMVPLRSSASRKAMKCGWLRASMSATAASFLASM